MVVQLCPPFVDLCTMFDPAYTTSGLWREVMIGKVHWKRNLRSRAGCPIGLSGHEFTLRVRSVRMSLRVRRLP